MHPIPDQLFDLSNELDSMGGGDTRIGCMEAVCRCVILSHCLSPFRLKYQRCTGLKAKLGAVKCRSRGLTIITLWFEIHAVLVTLLYHSHYVAIK